MIKSRLILALVLLILIVQGCKKDKHDLPDPNPNPIVIQPPPAFGFYVVGYFPSYRNLADIPDVKFRMCNVVNYAFFGVNSVGTWKVTNASLTSQVIAKAKANGAKAFLSINDGSGVGKNNFRNMASTASG